MQENKTDLKKGDIVRLKIKDPSLWYWNMGREYGVVSERLSVLYFNKPFFNITWVKNKCNKPIKGYSFLEIECWELDRLELLSTDPDKICKKPNLK